MKSKLVKTLIKKLIKKCGGKKEAADKLGISLGYLYMIEKGRPVSLGLKKLIEIALDEIIAEGILPW